MSNVFDVLSEDHEEVKRMLAGLATRPTVLASTGANLQQLGSLKKRVEDLIIAASRHEAVEETYLWPVVRERHPSGADLADRAIAQEHDGKKALDLLGKLDVTQPEFEDVLASFVKGSREHIFFEETVVWPALAIVLSAQEANELGRKLEQGKKNARTRRPSATPPNPAVQKGAGTAVAAIGRLRDKVSGRGRHRRGRS
jgi:hemerythrin-like domain-containing protein